MHRTQYSHLTNEEFYRLLVSQPFLTPLETEAMMRLEIVMNECDSWDGLEDGSAIDIENLTETHDSMEDNRD